MTDDPHERRRERMVAEQLVGIVDPRIRAAMRRVPRHLFVPPDVRHLAYEDRPLAIGHGQTISQPYMVAAMTQALELRGDERVLEVGTGSGYQAAVLCAMGMRVCTIERVPELSRQAQVRLRDEPIHFHVGDGTLGIPEEAPFDAIVVTAGAPAVPVRLIEQLRERGGRMVIPVGDVGEQDLLLVRRSYATITQTRLFGCAFVKLVGQEGWSPCHRTS